jgi:hypothetical protein
MTSHSRARDRRVMLSFSPLIGMRERGAWGAPWVVPVASGEAGLMRVSARAPDRSLFPARKPEEFTCSPGRITPRGLSSMSARRFIVSDKVRSPAWTLRFLSPEAMPAPSVSPRNQHAGLQALLRRRLAAGPRSSRDWLALQHRNALQRGRPRRPTALTS